MLKEFIWGTPQEIQAHQTYTDLKKLKKRKRLTPTQQARFDSTQPFSRRLFLRRGLAIAGITTLALTPPTSYIISHLGESSQPRKDPAKKYDGPIDAFKGLEYVSTNSILELTESLENTKHPFLGKIAQGVCGLLAAKTKPAEFPGCIDEGSFPFTFVQDNTDTFTTQFQISKLSRVNFLIPSQGAIEPQTGIEQYLVGIKFGLKNTPLSDELLQPAMLLAKEYLTLLHTIAFNEEFYDLTMKLFPDVDIVDPEWKKITDPALQKAIGRRLLHNNLNDESNINWKVLDGFSMLLLGPVLNDLVKNKKITNYRNIKPIIIAANIFSQSSAEFQKDLRDFMESWREQTGFTFPAGTGAKSVSQPYVNAVVNLESQLN